MYFCSCCPCIHYKVNDPVSFVLFQARSLYLIVIGSLIGVCILQFVNDMILCSLVLSFAVASVALMSFHVSVTL